MGKSHLHKKQIAAAGPCLPTSPALRICSQADPCDPTGYKREPPARTPDLTHSPSCHTCDHTQTGLVSATQVRAGWICHYTILFYLSKGQLLRACLKPDYCFLVLGNNTSTSDRSSCSSRIVTRVGEDEQQAHRNFPVRSPKCYKEA